MPLHSETKRSENRTMKLIALGALSGVIMHQVVPIVIAYPLQKQSVTLGQDINYCKRVTLINVF